MAAGPGVGTRVAVAVGEGDRVAVGAAVRMTRSEQATPINKNRDRNKTRGLMSMANQICTERLVPGLFW